MASSGLLFGEEPCFSGSRGSGTIFFTGCSSHCFFCQNYQNSNEGMGQPFTPERLLDMARELVDRGVHNLNFVTPDHFWPYVEFVVCSLRAEGCEIPTLFNRSGYQREDMVARYAECMDIFMPDFKFADPVIAPVCMGDERYPEATLVVLRRMVERKGFLHSWDPTGYKTAQSGVLVRHLTFPGHVENTLSVLRLLCREFGRSLPLSVISQFHPVPACRKRRQLTRRISEKEQSRVHEEIIELDFKHVLVQPICRQKNLLPDVDREEPFEGNRR